MIDNSSTLYLDFKSRHTTDSLFYISLARRKRRKGALHNSISIEQIKPDRYATD